MKKGVHSSRVDPPRTTAVLGSSKVGGQRVSSSLDRGVVELESQSLLTMLGFATIRSSLSTGPNAKFTDL